VPLYVLGRRMESLYPYVPIAAGIRTSIGIFSYVDAITFGINADFDAVPDVDVLSRGIAHGIDELRTLAEKQASPPPKTKRRNARPVPTGPSRTAAAKPR
jgi:diacylglycerol O-acyltransferase